MMLSWMSGGRRNEAEETCNRTSSLCGYLWKMKRSHQKKMLIPQWNKRWFSIEGRLLKWYAVASSEESSGMVDLRFITSVSAFEVQGVYSFTLSYPDRNLLLRASNLSDMDKWMRALQFQADIVRGGDGMTIVTDSNTSGSSPQGKGRGTKEKYRPPTLEANLEAAMVRLQILENSVLKLSSNNLDLKFESSVRESADKRENEKKVKEKGNKTEDSNTDLKPEDVRLFEGTRAKSEFIKRPPTMPPERVCSDRGRLSYNYDHDSNDNKSDDDEHFFANRGKDNKNEQDEDNDRPYSSKTNKSPRSTKSKTRDRLPDDSPCPFPDRDTRGIRLSQAESNSTGVHGNSNSNIYSSPPEDVIQPTRKMSNSDASMEEISPGVRNSARSRGRASRQRDFDRDRDRDRDRDSDEDNGRDSNRDRDRDRDEDKDRDRAREREKAKAAQFSLSRGVSASDKSDNGRLGDRWGYEGEIYNNTSEQFFEGSVSRKQALALNIAAGRNSAYKNESGGSSRNSLFAAENNGGPDYDDLPEMDLTVRKPNQRSVKERRAERGNRNLPAPNSVEIQSSSGWV